MVLDFFQPLCFYDDYHDAFFFCALDFYTFEENVEAMVRGQSGDLRRDSSGSMAEDKGSGFLDVSWELYDGRKQCSMAFDTRRSSDFISSAQLSAGMPFL